MYLTDYHTHSILSFDGHAPLDQLAGAAVAAGLQELCITDHCDLLDEDGNRANPWSWPPAVAQFQETNIRCQGKLKLKLGLELGEACVDPGLAREIISLPELDFVIGSVHNLSEEAGGKDLFCIDYSDEAVCRQVLDNYFDCLAQLVPTGMYDVLGHIIYPLRYMPDSVSLDRYWEQIRAILRATVEMGRGIEVNTYRGKTTSAWKPVLALYRDCGGEIVTTGSDAHTPEDVGKGIGEACALLKETGFDYVAVYEKHKPEFHRL